MIDLTTMPMHTALLMQLLMWDLLREEQEESFIRQIEIAKKANKPLIIHSRDAMNKTYLTLKEYHAEIIGGVMHSFSGNTSFL